MQVNTFSNIELSCCLDALYGPKNGSLSSKVFTCVNSTHSHLKNAIMISSSEDYMSKVICKIKSLGFVAWENNGPIIEKDYFYSVTDGKGRLTLMTEKSVNIFKDTLYKDLQADEAALNNYTFRVEYKKAAL